MGKIKQSVFIACSLLLVVVYVCAAVFVNTGISDEKSDLQKKIAEFALRKEELQKQNVALDESKKQIDALIKFQEGEYEKLINEFNLKTDEIAENAEREAQRKKLEEEIRKKAEEQRQIDLRNKMLEEQQKAEARKRSRAS